MEELTTQPVTSFFPHTGRDLDPHLHTHNAVMNRATTKAQMMAGAPDRLQLPTTPDDPAVVAARVEDLMGRLVEHARPTYLDQSSQDDLIHLRAFDQPMATDDGYHLP